MAVRAAVLRAAFELLYRNRWLYWLASTIPFAGQWRVWQRRVLPRIVGERVLEVGCGTGTLLGDLLAAGYDCLAVDASPQMVAAARAELRRRGQDHSGSRVSQARAQHLPYADGSFDTVISTFPTPYIADEQAIREIARVLRPGGRLVVVVGASLLSTRVWLLPFIAIQRLAYGGPAPRAAPVRGSGSGAHAITTVPVPQRQSGIPLEAAGMVRREECDRSPLWEVYITIGDKPHG
ncbi:MAG TPA: class I SAM-dependent methyltransferase [Ktedonobacterales bacterium]|nr:class I SAM-dependent methyltransferase [Ktedonobacterales bacterium]